MADYIYSVSGDFPNQQVDPQGLHQEILDESAITKILDGVNVELDVCTIVFLTSLSAPEVTALNGVVAAHDGTAIIYIDPVKVHIASTGNPHSVTSDQAGAAPTVHTHVEADITDLDHDALKIQGVPVDDSAIGDGKTLVYDSTTGDLRYELITPTSGITITSEWKFNTSTTDSDPGNGRFRLNNTTLPSSTFIYLDDISDQGVDMSLLLSRLKSGDLVYIQQTDISDRALLFEVSGDSVDGSGYWKVPVQNGEGTGNDLQNNKVCSFIFQYSGIDSVTWGSITGTLSNQTDLQLELDGKSDVGHTHVEADITDLDHDALKIKGVVIDDTDIGDGKTLVYDSTTGELRYELITGTGDVTAATNLVDNSLIRGDGGGKGVQDSEDTGVSWTLSDLGQLYGVASFPAEMFLMVLENQTDSGEFIQTVGFNGNPAHEFRQNDSGDGLLRIYMDATISSGNEYFIAQDGVVKIGDVADGVDLNFDLLINNDGGTAIGGGTLGWKNAAGDTIGIIAPASITASYTLTLPPDDGDIGEVLTTDGAGVLTWTAAGSGDVTAAANLTDNSIVRGDGGAKGVQDSDGASTIDWTISDTGKLVGIGDESGDYVMTIQNLNATSGSGFAVMAGEALGDIAFHIADADDSFQIMELEADQGHVTFGETYAQTLIDRGVVYGVDIQHTGVTSDFNTQFGQYRMAGVPIPLKTYMFFADQVDYPRGTNWNVNNGAPASADSNNAALKIRLFDDTTDEAIGFMVTVPEQAIEMIVRTKARRESGTTPQNAIMQLHERSIGDNAAISGWTATTLTTIALPGNENFQYDETTDDLAGWGLTAGETYQMQLSRDANAGGDTLVGDLALLSVEVEFR